MARIDSQLTTRLRKYDVYQSRSDSLRSHARRQSRTLQRSDNVLDLRSQKKPVGNVSTLSPASTSGVANKGATAPSLLRKHAASSAAVNNHIQSSHRLAFAAIKNSFYNSSFHSNPMQLMAPYIDKTKRLRQLFFYGTGTLVFLFAAIAGLRTNSVTNQVREEVNEVLSVSSQGQDAQGVPQGTGEQPAEARPSSAAVASYQVEPDKPRFFRIPELGVDSRVKQLGVNTAGAVDAPWNIHDTGWYTDTINPGSKNGVSLILGHVSGWSGPGVFKDIGSLQQGSSIQVERGDGTVLSYAVDKVVTLDVDQIDMSEILYTVEKGTQSLRLMTCAGSYDKETGQFSSRTVVYASPV